jgi:hypothetical protein
MAASGNFGSRTATSESPLERVVELVHRRDRRAGPVIVIQKKNAEQAVARRSQDACAFAEVVPGFLRQQVREERCGIDDVEGLIVERESIVLGGLSSGRVVFAIEDVRLDELEIRPPGLNPLLSIANARDRPRRGRRTVRATECNPAIPGRSAVATSRARGPPTSCAILRAGSGRPGTPRPSGSNG